MKYTEDEENLIEHGWHVIDYPAPRDTELYKTYVSSETVYSHPDHGEGVWSLREARRKDYESRSGHRAVIVLCCIVTLVIIVIAARYFGAL